jgi:hypothetical protein
MPYILYALLDVLEVLQNRNALGKRLNLVFSHLSAHDRTSVDIATHFFPFQTGSPV